MLWKLLTLVQSEHSVNYYTMYSVHTTTQCTVYTTIQCTHYYTMYSIHYTVYSITWYDKKDKAPKPLLFIILIMQIWSKSIFVRYVRMKILNVNLN